YRELESEISDFNDLETEIVQQESKIIFMKSQLISSQKRVEEYKERLNGHISSFNWSNCDLSHDEILRKIEQANVLSSVIKELNENSEKFQNELDTLSDEHKRYNASLDDL